MKITYELKDGCIIARISGSIQATEGLKLAEVTNIQAKAENLILDLRDIDFIDSTGLGVLVSVIKSYWDSKTKLVLSAPTPAVDKTFRMTRIDRIVPITDSIVSAIEHLRKEAS